MRKIRIQSLKQYGAHVAVRTNARTDLTWSYAGDPAAACSCGWFNTYETNQQAGCGITGHFTAVDRKRKLAAS